MQSIKLGDIEECTNCKISKYIKQVTYTVKDNKTIAFCSDECWEEYLAKLHPDKKGR